MSKNARCAKINSCLSSPFCPTWNLKHVYFFNKYRPNALDQIFDAPIIRVVVILIIKHIPLTEKNVLRKNVRFAILTSTLRSRQSFRLDYTKHKALTGNTRIPPAETDRLVIVQRLLISKIMLLFFGIFW